ncbi:hypothetical protein QC281_08770 [Streptomyces sp. DH17]|nr:hypothetical protein [Streptomyces sp. DH17]
MKRTTTAVALVAALTALSACSSGGSTDAAPPTEAASPSVDYSAAELVF